MTPRCRCWRRVSGGPQLDGCGSMCATIGCLVARPLRLRPISTAPIVVPSNRAACRDCPLRSQCTGNQFRSVSRMENEAVLDRMAARLAQRPGILDRRRETVEHPFGTIKQWMYQGAFLMRGLEKVRGEFSLTALAYNLRRAPNRVGFAELMAAVQGVQG